MEVERMKFLTFRTVGWKGQSKTFSNLGGNGHELATPEQEQEHTAVRMAWAGGRRWGYKGMGNLVLVGASNRD